MTSATEPVPPRFNLARYCLGGDPAIRRADKTALIVVHDADAPPEAAEQWSYGALDEAVRRVAAGLRAQGIGPGTRILIRLDNTSDYPLLFFGAIAAGCVALPSSAQLTPAEVRFILEDAQAHVLAVSTDLAFEDVPKGVRVMDAGAIEALKVHEPAVGYYESHAEDPAFLVYTSGTSGRPKGVVHAQRSAWGRRPMYEGWYDIHPDDIILHAGAFNWTYTLGVGLTDPWANGATTVVYNGPKDPRVWPRLIAAYGASLFAAVPSLYRRILKYAADDVRCFASLRHGLTAGEALAPGLADQWRAATGTPLYEALGMSECSTYISSAPAVPPKPGSPGKPQRGRKVAILPVEGGETPLAPNEIGLLAVHRSDPGLMLGYWNRPQEDAAVTRGAWFVGGDLASMDEDGYVWFQGRADDVMNAMGYRVSPGEVEAALLLHPEIAEVAVTEMQVREDVKVIAAFCVPRDPTLPPDKEALSAFVAEHLAAYKVPRAFHFLESLPRTANGKVIRRALAGAVDGPDAQDGATR